MYSDIPQLYDVFTQQGFDFGAWCVRGGIVGTTDTLRALRTIDWDVVAFYAPDDWLGEVPSSRSLGPAVTTLCGMKSDAHHSAGWDALATAAVGGLSFVRDLMFGCGLYAGMTQVVHIRQVIGRVRWWRRVRAEWCHRRDTQEGFETCWKDFKAAY